MDTEIVLYQLKSDKNSKRFPVLNDYSVVKWTPSFTRIIPPKKNMKYINYWFFHYLKIFKNRNYSAVQVFNSDILVSSLLVVPAHFKWPFMNKNDVQFTYVMTNKDYRGKGIAMQTIMRVINDLAPVTNSFWYVTDTNNFASIRVAEKLGFKLAGKGKKSKILGILNIKKR